MTEAKNTHKCLNCNRPETQVPLMSLRYSNQAIWICTQCLPTLIHNPQQLVGKLAGAENLEPADQDD